MKIGVKIFARDRNETLERKLTENIYDDMRDAESYIWHMIKALFELGFSVKKTETGYLAENKEFYTYEIVIGKY